MSAAATLSGLPQLLLTELTHARCGVVVLAIDGLSYPAAVAAGWQATRLHRLRSTFPSTSATAWFTAVTGVGPAEHGVPGMVYRVPGTGALINAITGQVLAQGPADPAGEPHAVLPHPTVFDRAGWLGHRPIVLGRELAGLAGEWVTALLHGATVLAGPGASELAAQAAEPASLVRAVVAQVDAVRAVVDEASVSPSRLLLWIYINIDDYVHIHGYDAAVVSAMRRLGECAQRWAGRGWTVVAHSDHGQVHSQVDPALAEAWSALDDPADCYLPSGGAGRVRWLYPHPARVDSVARRTAAALGSSAIVLTGSALHRAGLAGPVLAGRVGPVVAVAQGTGFPVPDSSLRFEHGGRATAEAQVPLALWSWRAAPGRPAWSPSGSAAGPHRPR